MASIATATKAPPRSASRPWLEVLSNIWAWLFLAILLLIFTLASDVFLTARNLQNILANMSILTIIAMGQTFAIIAGGIDLSAGWIMGMVTVVSALTMNAFPAETSLWVIVPAGALVGLLAAWIAGFVNGTLVARLNVPPFIATLGMFGIARGLGFMFSEGMPVPIRVRGIGNLGNGYLFYYHPSVGLSFLDKPVGLPQEELRQIVQIVPFVLIVMLVLLFAGHLLLSRTKFGLHTYAIGGNKEAATRAGIPVAHRTTLIYMLSATFAAFAGLVYNVRFTNGAANAGETMVLDTVAAVVIGGASLFGGSGTLIGTLIGALIIAVLGNGLVITNVNPYWQYIAVGSVIIVAVLIDQAREKLLR